MSTHGNVDESRLLKGDDMRIKVKATHIRKGVQCSYCRCPVNLALEEATGEICSTGYTTLTCGARQFATPRTVIEFMKQFDAGGRRTVAPFEFAL